jgi:hypothetical protein
VQAQGEREVAARAGVVKGDGDLAVGPLAQRPAVLVRYADRVAPALGEAGVVEHEHALGRGEVLGQKRAVAGEYGVLVPGTLADELLERLLGVFAVQGLAGG